MGESIVNISRREAAFLLAVSIAAPSVAFADADIRLKLRILATSDLHCYLESYDYYQDKPEDTVGLVRVASLVKAARAQAPNLLLFDNGDLIQGNPLGDLAAANGPASAAAPHPVIKAMNAMGYDAAVPGNHDFNYGLEFLDGAIAGARFPYVLANVDLARGGSLLPPYVILDRVFQDESGHARTVKVGVIGLVTPQIMMWDKAHLAGKVTAVDMVARARQLAPELRAKGADLVIALAHTGLDSRPMHGMDENAGYYLTADGALDAVITGHQHRVFPDPAYAGMPDADLAQGRIHAHPAVMPGFYGSHLGVIDLELRQAGGAWRVVTATSEARPISTRDHGKTTPIVASDPDLTALVAPDHERTLVYIRQPIGRTTGPIDTFFAIVEPDPASAIVAAVQRLAVEKSLHGGEYGDLPVLSAVAPFRAGGAPGPDYYTDIQVGAIAIKNVADLYVYPNTLQAVRVTGAGLREWLEMSAILYNRIDPANAAPQMLVGDGAVYNRDMISGVTYEIDVTVPPRYDRSGHVVAPNARRIRNLAYDGKPVADDAIFIVATNSYRASGGGSFPGLDGANVVLATPDILPNLIADYIRQVKEITPSVEANWRLAPIDAPVDVRFQTSPKAKSRDGGQTRVALLGPGDNGFDLYRVDLRAG
jgi:2',3'-cyclic-nucleotide 2'-phosphodiesterase/3'-nucleotidase